MAGFMKMTSWAATWRYGISLGVATMLSVFLLNGSASAREQLTIGVSQFPSNFHPMIDSTLARTYINGMGQRPVTAYDPDWNLTCLLCT